MPTQRSLYPTIDFSPIGEWPNAWAKNAERAREEELRSILSSTELPLGPDGTTDYSAAISRALQAGNLGAVETFSRLQNAAATQRRADASLAETKLHNRRNEGRPQIFGSAEGGYYAIDRNGNVVQAPQQQQPQPDVFPENPLAQQPASQVSRPQVAPEALPPPEQIPGTETVQPPWLQGGQLTPAPAAPAATEQERPQLPPGVRQLVPPRTKEATDFTPEARDVIARQLINGDVSGMSSLGRGAQGDKAIKAVRNRAVEILVGERGMSPDQAAAHLGEAQQKFKASTIGKNAWARTAANREANLDIILKATEAAFPAALDASKELPRTTWVPLNRIIQKGQVMTSDPRLLKFGMANLQLAEHWARAMNPTGVMRESDRDMALHFLGTATSHATYEQAVKQLKVQIEREAAAVRGGHTVSSVPGSTQQIPKGAIDDLLSNPGSAAQFDGIFGPGQAARILGSVGGGAR